MTSNMFAGEKRWSSTRRSAMTVLGKVAVPKPLNLPSQRLENHGLDPNAEIVPKGTNNWGNRSTGNAWNSLALSPKSDGGSGFSSDVGARPSSGGSGTRPSTAASDRGHEPVPSSWGSNSRPSSASGALSSNQSALTSLRPHSAETRPGSSSQLSRFAETLTDNSVALAPPGISDKLGGSSSTNDAFNLSSGDFPTLGSQKDSGKNTDYRDNGSTSRPSSSSGMTASVKEKKTDASVGDAIVNANVRTGNVDTWRRADSEHFEDGGTKHSMNKWQGGGEPYAYPNATMPPQLVDAWRAHQMNASSPGVWYRGPPGGPPYRPHLGPGGFPLDPFPYYGPQIQTPGLANTRPMPPPNSRPRGHHPGNPDLYRPHIPEAYMHPSMPIRPGFYPSPMPYEGYYRPPMGFGSAKEHDIAFTGMPPGPPPVYNMYSGEHSSDPGKEHARPSADGCAGNSLGLERVESVYQHDNQGQCRVILKHHHETVGKEENSDGKQTVSIVDKRGPERAIEKNEGGNGRTNELVRTHKQESSWSVGSQKHDSDMSKSNIPFGTSNTNNTNVGLATRSKHSVSSNPQVSHVSTTTPKPILIQKIEGLNAKTRACDSGTSIRGNFQANDRNRGGGDLIQSEKVGVPLQDINPKSTTFTEAAIPRVLGHEMQGKLDHYGRRFNAQGGDGWQKKPHAVESAHAISVGNAKLGTPCLQDLQISEDAVEKPRTSLRGNKVEGETSCAEFDKSNGEAQRAKMREMARERAKQLQKEEEERKREQKAKALLKLEELNKRTLPADGLVQKVETPATPTCVNEQENREGPVVVGSVAVAAKINTSTLNLVSTKGVTESSTQITDSTEYKVPPQSGEGSMSRHKPMGHNKQKQNSTRGKILMEKPSVATHVKLEVPGSLNQVVANGFPSEVGGGVDERFHNGDLSLLNSSKNVDEPPAFYRKKNNRSSKMKPKVDDDTTVKNPVHVSAPSDSMEHSVGREMPHALESKPDPNSSYVQNDAITIEEANCKPQRSHPLPKNQHTNRSLEKFRASDGAIWAPVRVVQTKIEVSEEASGKISDEIPVGKSDTEGGQNNQKSKRAEMKRYVPKPVAMGHTQQVLVSSSDDQAVPNEVVVERDEPDSQKMVGSDPPQYKQKKIQGSWRQRESTNAHSSHNVSKGEPKSSDDTRRSFSEHSDSTSAVVTQSMKDERQDGQRRYPSKSQKNMASNSSHKTMNYYNNNNSGGHSDNNSSQKEKGNNNALKESRGGIVGDGNASSHWQPKSQSNSHIQQNRRSGGKNSAAAFTEEGNNVIIGWSENNEERGEERVKLPVDQGKSQDVKKEMKTAAAAPAKKGGSPSSPNQNPNEMVVESFPVDTTRSSYVRHSGGLYKNGNQNNSRYGRGGGGGGGYEYGNNNSGDRQRQNNNNSRLEYKPVGPPNTTTTSKKPNNNNNQFEVFAESSRPKYREKNPH
ncbi:protein MODIFIER OF SNC1 1-like [Impatiens glandulifera]|uniref:protein MODIFIER OF SNC1 1-like n=1 Tax=Impatiens glandulifera TaxID=253017 RepID=UPI001FB09FB3|nr:protein MODIFIER OF SNC1 1-like [Impatiens glandulifera]